MEKKEIPTVEQYRELLVGLRSVLENSRAMLRAFNDLDQHLRLPLVAAHKLNTASNCLRGFTYKVENAIQDTIRGAYHYRPKVFQEQCGELVREIQKLVDEG